MSGRGGAPEPRPSYSVRIRELASEQRPRERLARDGAEALSDADLLAMVLGSGSSRGSAIELGQALLASFGSLRRLADASVSELRAHHGVGPAKASTIKAALELARRMQIEAAGERPLISGAADAVRALGGRLDDQPDERLLVVLLDTRHRVIRVEQVAQGSVNRVAARMADVFRAAVREGSPTIILAHNHPSGDPTPSRGDLELTYKAARAGDLLSIKVLDHVVVGRGADSFVSLKETGHDW